MADGDIEMPLRDNPTTTVEDGEPRATEATATEAARREEVSKGKRPASDGETSDGSINAQIDVAVKAVLEEQQRSKPALFAP